MRNTKIFAVEREGRDKGKVFCLTEMSAWNAELWALRLFLALAKSGVEVPPDVRELGLQGIAVIGLKAIQGLQFDEARVLLNEMMTCVKIIADPVRNPETMRALVENDVEEVATILRLRREVFELHLGFSLADAEKLWASAEEAGRALQSTQTSPL